MKEKHPQKSHFIEKGTYGCVYTPPLPCKDSKASKGKRTVGKIIRKQDAVFELNLTSVIEGIPDWEDYFIIQEEDRCKSKNFSELRKDYQKNCSIFQRANNKNLTQLISSYGGRTLLSVQITSNFNFMGTLKHILTAGSLLAESGICHYDIKETNIVVDSEGMVRMIDFGSAFIGDTISENNMWHQIYAGFLPEYEPQPPELSILDGFKEKMTIHECVPKIMAAKKVFKVIDNLFSISKSENEFRLYEFWKQQEEWKGGSWVPFFHKFWPVFDSWAVGVMFIRILNDCLMYPGFVERTWNPNKQVIKKVMTGLLEVDPRMRLTCKEALSFL